jgi:hypothetical protein
MIDAKVSSLWASNDADFWNDLFDWFGVYLDNGPDVMLILNQVRSSCNYSGPREIPLPPDWGANPTTPLCLFTGWCIRAYEQYYHNSGRGQPYGYSFSQMLSWITVNRDPVSLRASHNGCST